MRSRTPLFLVFLWSAVIGHAGGIFDFSYQFGTSPGDTFGGTFSGTKSGNLVTVDSLTSVWVNDPSQTLDAMVTGGYDVTVSGWVAPAVMSSTLLENNFSLLDLNGWGTFQFSIAPDDTGEVTAFGYEDQSGASDYDYLGAAGNPAPAGLWTLTEQTTSSVPDGGATVLMLFGSLAALGLLRRRR